MRTILAYWAVYFALHSLLASFRVKAMVHAHWPEFPYRLAYNILAGALLLPGAWLLWGRTWPVLWEFDGGWRYAAWLLQGLAVTGFLWSLRYYDMGAFLGLKPESEGYFKISPFHRFVRHPWYCFALVLIWSSDMNSGRLATSIMATLYLFFGSRHEESMLVERFGAGYAEYRKKVPGLIPLPWKYLSRREAATLVK